jgi:hypothetical protein
VTNLALNRLGEREVATLVHEIAGNMAFSANLIGEIVDRTDGVPLFVEELTKAVRERGRRRAWLRCWRLHGRSGIGATWAFVGGFAAIHPEATPTSRLRCVTSAGRQRRRRVAVRLRPNYPSPISALRCITSAAGGGGATYRENLQLRPNHPEAQTNLGNAVAGRFRRPETLQRREGRPLPQFGVTPVLPTSEWDNKGKLEYQLFQ